MEKNKDKTIGNKHIAFIISFMTIAVYLFSEKFTHEISQVRVPFRDGFTYTIGHFYVIDAAQSSYLKTVFGEFSHPSWFWLQKGLVAILSPILFKEPYSIMLFNYCLFGLVSWQLFRIGLKLGHSTTYAFILSMSFWLFPWHYQIDFSPIALTELMQDTSLNLALLAACCSWLIFSFNPNCRRESILAGFLSGVALWGRSNALPYVIIIILVPFLTILWQVIRLRDARASRNLVICCSIFGLLTAWYYHHTLSGILEYYSYVSLDAQKPQNFISKIEYNLKFADWILTSAPGAAFLFKNIEKNHPSILLALSVASHCVVLLCVSIVFFGKTKLGKESSSPLKICALTGAFIYFAVFLPGLLSFGPNVEYRIHAFYYPLAPMLLGLVLSVIALGSWMGRYFDFLIISQWTEIKQTLTITIISLFILAYAHGSLKIYSPLEPFPGAATPHQLKSVALNFDKITQGRSVVFLWTNLYSPHILEYYRIQAGIPALSNINHDFAHYFWHQNPKPTPKLLQLVLRQAIRKADFLIVPEQIKDYALLIPYPISRNPNMLAAVMNEPSAPRFYLRMILHDKDNVRLLLIERVKQERPGNLLLPLPYGEPLNQDILSSPLLLSDYEPFKTIAPLDTKEIKAKPASL